MRRDMEEQLQQRRVLQQLARVHCCATPRSDNVSAFLPLPRMADSYRHQADRITACATLPIHSASAISLLLCGALAAVQQLIPGT